MQQKNINNMHGQALHGYLPMHRSIRKCHAGCAVQYAEGGFTCVHDSVPINEALWKHTTLASAWPGVSVRVTGLRVLPSISTSGAVLSPLDSVSACMAN